MATPTSVNSIKMKLVTALGYLDSADIEEKESARIILVVTLREIVFRTIEDVDECMCIKIIDMMEAALKFTMGGEYIDAKKELSRVVDEISIKSIVRKHMILRESDGDLSILPYDVREKIASYI